MSSLIAIIEDEEDMLELLEHRLNNEGFETIGFLSTNNVEQLLKEEEVDLIIADRNLKGVEGAEFISSLRSKGYQIPVIFLSAKDKESDKIKGFELGGDDYITKPFSMQELILRIKALLKRTKGEELEVYQFRDIIIKIKSKEVFVDKEKVELTKLEFQLLLEFIKNKNSVLNRDYLLDHVWGNNDGYQDRTVNVAIKRLREKIDPSKDKNYFKSIRGEGYILC